MSSKLVTLIVTGIVVPDLIKEAQFSLAYLTLIFRTPFVRPLVTYRNVHYIAEALFPDTPPRHRVMLSVLDVLRMGCALKLVRCGIESQSAVDIARRGITDGRISPDLELDLASQINDLVESFSGWQLLALWTGERWQYSGHHREELPEKLFDKLRHEPGFLLPLEPMARLLGSRMIEELNERKDQRDGS